MQESKLIFIVSQPRSGSTLLQKLISNNDWVDTVSEPWLLLPFLSLLRSDLELVEAKFIYKLAADGIADYLKKRDIENDYKRALKSFILNLYKVKNENQYFIDKTPRYYEILPDIIELFPNARFIILKRNPFASLNSMLSTWARNRLEYKYLRSFYRDFLNAPFLIQEFCDKYGDKSNVKILKYEDLAQNPEKEIKLIYDWLGIPFSKNALNLTNNKKTLGIYGDDVYKNEPLSAVSDKGITTWQIELKKSKALGLFFSEYKRYLSENFLARYGYPQIDFSARKAVLRRNDFDKLLQNIEADGSEGQISLKKRVKDLFELCFKRRLGAHRGVRH